MGKMEKITIPNLKWITILLAIGLAISLIYIFAYPKVESYYMKKAKVLLITNIITNLKTQGFVDITVGEQVIRLVPQVG